MDEGFIIFVVLAFLFIYSEIRATRSKINFLENKIDTLLKNNGIVYDEKLHVPKDVLTAITLGHKLKAIRLYRDQTGASFKEAQEIIGRLVKDI
ncbi:hypothetical protein [Shewanella sp.]|uniref:hypothetical protein n=1 Tax=Shewanella sp. TaxID=50422 RepID=UPI001EBE6559|nr:hypothetical protein [Shewanella sp.]NRB22090.1 hypothetical protein [Shewanella sp.]